MRLGLSTRTSILRTRYSTTIPEFARVGAQAAASQLKRSPMPCWFRWRQFLKKTGVWWPMLCGAPDSRNAPWKWHAGEKLSCSLHVDLRPAKESPSWILPRRKGPANEKAASLVALDDGLG